MIQQIGAGSPTVLRAHTDRYLRAVSPRLADSEGSDLPHRISPHPHHRDRSLDSQRGQVLCFLIGNACLAYYAALSAEQVVLGLPARRADFPDEEGYQTELNGSKEWARQTRDTLHRRLRQLEELVAAGIRAAVVHGSDQEGYTLVSPATAEALRRVEQAKKLQAERRRLHTKIGQRQNRKRK